MTTRAPDTLPRRLDWQAAALCRTDPDPFFCEQGGSANDARRICAACPVRLQCMTEAMTVEDGLGYAMRGGIWGGLTPRERDKWDRVRVLAPTPADSDSKPQPAPEPEPTSATPDVPRKHSGGRPLAPCGTRAAYERHQRRGEEIDVKCREWREEYAASRRRRPAVCGTGSGRSRHQRRGEPVCRDCRRNHQRAERRRLAKKKAAAATASRS